MNIIQGYDNDKNILDIEHDILQLNKNIFPKTVLTHLKPLETEKVYWIVVLWMGKPIAQSCLGFLKDKNAWYMSNFGVRRFRRKEGWGRFLFQQVKKFTKNDKLIWEVENDNINAQLFYRKMGAKDFNNKNQQFVTMTL